MAYAIEYLPKCWEDVANIPRNDLKRIRRAIENRLALAPDRLGRPLRGDLKGRWRIRVGDYRVIYTLTGDKVLILMIGNRRDVYDA
jgi:mRNA interferase RelE/StbE